MAPRPAGPLPWKTWEELTQRTVDQAVDRVGEACADLLYHIATARTVDDALVIHQRAEVLVAICIDVSSAARRRADQLT